MKKVLIVFLSLMLSICAFVACEKVCKEHSFGEWTVTKEATCTTAGKESRECEKCGETETREIAALGHSFTNYESNSDATCTSDGTKTAKCDHGCGKPHTITDEGTAFGHSYGAWVSNGNGTHTKTCANDDTHKITEPCHGGEATCTAKAICDDCNAEYGEYNHVVDDSGWCTKCDKIVASTNGLKYSISADNSFAEIIGYNGRSSKICIADTYNGVPIVSIKSSAFSSNQSITEVAIAEGITSIGEDAFWGCSNLSKVTIPDSVTSIGGSAFEGCTNLTSISISNSVTSIEYCTFKNCSSLTNVTVPSNVTSIGNYAFAKCSKLKSIKIPDSVTSIGEGAFSNCSNLSYNEYDNACYLGNENNKYMVLVQAKSTSITSCIVNTYCKIICGYAFDDCSVLSKISIPTNITSIGAGAFDGCSSLVYTESEGMYYLGNESNNYVVLVKAVSGYICYDINDNCKIIYPLAFYFILLDYIGGRSYSVCIPAGLRSIGAGAFSYCESLTSVYYKGSESEWGAIMIGKNNDNLTEGTRYYYSESNPFEGENAEKEGNYWHYDTDGKTIVVWVK